jgi:neogenin
MFSCFFPLIHAESVVPGEPSSLRLRALTNSIMVSWTPPSSAENIMVRGYALGYGIGFPDSYKLVLDAKLRGHTIKGLSEYWRFCVRRTDDLRHG